MFQQTPFSISRIALATAERAPEAAAWTPHPKFPGVSLRTLVAGADTGGAYSQHAVRIDPGCAIGEHIHPGQWESHLVLAGGGAAEIAGRQAAYAPGVLGVMPADTPHSVGAGAETLYILATFVPAMG